MLFHLKYIKSLFTIGLLGAFILNSIGPLPQAYAQAGPVLPKEVKPAILANLKGITVYPKDPFKFDFIIEPQRRSAGDAKEGIPTARNDNEDGGDAEAAGPDGRLLREQANQLIKYFLASLTTPEKDMWVNLSPYEKNRIIPESFGSTLMGRDLLAQDYLLKKITASLIHPDTATGKEFWSKVYKQAQEKFGNTNIPIDTFNKVWIMPDKATVWERGNSAFVVERHLKVMLEKDYVAAAGPAASVSPPSSLSLRAAGIPSSASPADAQELASQIVHEIIIPQLEKDVNTGNNFSQLREIYNAMILATWFKKRMQQTLLGSVYVNKNKINGVGYTPTQGHVQSENTKNVSLSTNDIYQQYLSIFKKGVFNFIKEEPDPVTGEMIPRKYFSGGMVGLKPTQLSIVETSLSNLPRLAQAMLPSDKAMNVTVNAMPTADQINNVVEIKEIREELFSEDFNRPLSDTAKQLIRRLFPSTTFEDWSRQVDDFPVDIGTQLDDHHKRIIVYKERLGFHATTTGFHFGLISRGETLYLTVGAFSYFPEAFADSTLANLPSHKRLFWWIKHKVEPFARQLGFNSIGLHVITKITPDMLYQQGYKETGVATEWIKPIDKAMTVNDLPWLRDLKSMVINDVPAGAEGSLRVIVHDLKEKNINAQTFHGKILYGAYGNTTHDLIVLRELFPNAQIVAVDWNPQAYSNTRKAFTLPSKITVRLADMADLNHVYQGEPNDLKEEAFEDESFDLVFAMSFMDIQRDAKVLSIIDEAYRVLKPGGHFIGDDLGATKRKIKLAQKGFIPIVPNVLGIYQKSKDTAMQTSNPQVMLGEEPYQEISWDKVTNWDRPGLANYDGWELLKRVTDFADKNNLDWRDSFFVHRAGIILQVLEYLLENLDQHEYKSERLWEEKLYFKITQDISPDKGIRLEIWGPGKHPLPKQLLDESSNGKEFKWMDANSKPWQGMAPVGAVSGGSQHVAVSNMFDYIAVLNNKVKIGWREDGFGGHVIGMHFSLDAAMQSTQVADTLQELQMMATVLKAFIEQQQITQTFDALAVWFKAHQGQSDNQVLANPREIEEALNQVRLIDDKLDKLMGIVKEQIALIINKPLVTFDSKGDLVLAKEDEYGNRALFEIEDKVNKIRGNLQGMMYFLEFDQYDLMANLAEIPALQERFNDRIIRMLNDILNPSQTDTTIDYQRFDSKGWPEFIYTRFLLPGLKSGAFDNAMSTKAQASFYVEKPLRVTNLFQAIELLTGEGRRRSFGHSLKVDLKIKEDDAKVITGLSPYDISFLMRHVVFNAFDQGGEEPVVLKLDKETIDGQQKITISIINEGNIDWSRLRNKANAATLFRVKGTDRIYAYKPNWIKEDNLEAIKAEDFNDEQILWIDGLMEGEKLNNINATGGRGKALHETYHRLKSAGAHLTASVKDNKTIFKMMFEPVNKTNHTGDNILHYALNQYQERVNAIKAQEEGIGIGSEELDDEEIQRPDGKIVSKKPKFIAGWADKPAFMRFRKQELLDAYHELFKGLNAWLSERMLTNNAPGTTFQYYYPFAGNDDIPSRTANIIAINELGKRQMYNLDVINQHRPGFRVAILNDIFTHADAKTDEEIVKNIADRLGKWGDKIVLLQYQDLYKYGKLLFNEGFKIISGSKRIVAEPLVVGTGVSLPDSITVMERHRDRAMASAVQAKKPDQMVLSVATFSSKGGELPEDIVYGFFGILRKDAQEYLSDLVIKKLNPSVKTGIALTKEDIVKFPGARKYIYTTRDNETLEQINAYFYNPKASDDSLLRIAALNKDVWEKYGATGVLDPGTRLTVGFGLGEVLGIDAKRKLLPEGTIAAGDNTLLSAAEYKAIKDSAMQSQDLGGIDMNASHLDLTIKRDEQGVPLPASLQDWSKVNINGLAPKIIKIEPVNLTELIGATH